MDSLDSPLPEDLDYGDEDMNDVADARNSAASEQEEDDFDPSNLAAEGTTPSFIFYESPTTSAVSLYNQPVDDILNDITDGYGSNVAGRESRSRSAQQVTVPSFFVIVRFLCRRLTLEGSSAIWDGERH